MSEIELTVTIQPDAAQRSSRTEVNDGDTIELKRNQSILILMGALWPDEARAMSSELRYEDRVAPGLAKKTVTQQFPGGHRQWKYAGDYSVTVDAQCEVPSQTGGHEKRSKELTFTVTVKPQAASQLQQMEPGHDYIDQLTDIAADYEEAVKGWMDFQRKSSGIEGKGEVDVGKQPVANVFRLFKIVNKAIANAGTRSSPNDLRNTAPQDALLDLLGIDANLYNKEYRKYLENKDIFGPSAKLHQPWKLRSLLGLDVLKETVTSTKFVQTDLPSAGLPPETAQKTVTNTVVNEFGIGPEILSEARKNLKEDPPLFVKHGQKLIAYTNGIENYALTLATLLKFGQEPFDLQQSSLDNDEINEQQQNFRAFVLNSDPRPNRYTAQLAKMPYQVQLCVLARVFRRLSKSEAGVRFMASMFAHRDSPGAIDPFNIFQPPERTDQKENSSQAPYVMASTGQDGIKNKIFESDHRLKVASDGNGLTDEAAEAAGYLADIAIQLTAGASYYVNKDTFGESRSEKKALVSQFRAILESKLFRDSDISSVNNQWPGSATESLADLTGHVAKNELHKSEWRWSDSIAVLSESASYYVSIDEHTTWFGTDIGEMSKGTGKLKIALAVWNWWTVTQEAYSESSQGQFDVGDATEASLVFLQYVDSINGGTEAVWKKLSDEQKQQWAKFLSGEGTPQGGIAKKLVDFAGEASTIIDIVFIAADLVRVSELLEKNDQDAALALSIGIAGNSLVLLGEYYAIKEGALLGTIGPGTLLIVGVMIGIATAAVVGALEDTATKTWLRHTIYGDAYDIEVEDERKDPNESSFHDPTSQQFGFTRNAVDMDAEKGVANIHRQISGYYSRARPLGDNTAKAYLIGDPPGERGTPVSDLYVLLKQTSKEISCGGAVYIKPILEYDSDDAGRRIHPCPILHKIKLDDFNADKGTDRWQTETPYVPTGASTTEIERRAQAFDWWNNETLKQKSEAEIGDAKAALESRASLVQKMSKQLKSGSQDNVLLYPDGKQRGKQTRSAAGSGQQVRKRIRENHPSLHKIAICIRGWRPALIGTWDLRKWSDHPVGSSALSAAYLELIYVPPGYEEAIREEKNIDLSDAPSASRKVVRVQQRNALQSTDVSDFKDRSADDLWE